MSEYTLTDQARELAAKYAGPWMDDKRLLAIHRELWESRELGGDVVELGTGEGHTAMFLRGAMNRIEELKRTPLHVFDAFPLGGTATWIQRATANGCCAGRVDVSTDTDAGKAIVLANFKRANLAAPVIHAGWFQFTLPQELPKSISFALVDADLGEAVATALMAIYDRLLPGARCVIDDYGSGWTPTVKPAVDRFMSGLPEQLRITVGGIQAAFTKVGQLPGIEEEAA